MVYALVGQSLSLVSTSIYSAFAPSFGNMVASENKASIAGVFGIFQFVFVMLNTVMYLCMTALLAPFANIYTSGATDINYMNISLACIMGLSGICSAYRIPYNIAVSTFGFFKETWKQPIICIFVSISVSIGLGILDSSFIVLGPTIFYIINFLYQHFCIKRLVPYLISSHVFIMLGISLFGFIISAYAGIKCAIPMSIISLLLAAVASLIASTIFTLGISRLLLPHEYRCALEYFYSHLPRRFRNA